MSSKVRRRIREALSLGVLVLAITTARSTLADHYRVPSESMQPTIQVGDRILVNKLAYGLRVPFAEAYLSRFEGPQRGDVVILTSPADGKTLVKRVMGLPGDRIEVSEGRVLVDERAVDEVRLGSVGGKSFGPTTIPAGRYLVLGDNREASFDGRYFGLVEEGRLLGKAERVYFRDGRFVWEDL